ncbi:hypothetical protein NP493_1169g00025 [Ridgeia piscesae]|uniref:Uncharacterized protein n=1 Tax=Ridgeia piscesae TaxID=27915 RepID=A0AAD9KE18_RIDPI|nr:hypothetical protein NP493_1169g00025 [Ridgeia piscesae]
MSSSTWLFKATNSPRYRSGTPSPRFSTFLSEVKPGSADAWLRSDPLQLTAYLRRINRPTKASARRVFDWNTASTTRVQACAGGQYSWDRMDLYRDQHKCLWSSSGAVKSSTQR